MRAGAIEDYTFLWWDVRPHPNLGTVETRIFDQQTRVEHTISLAALIVSLAHRLCALYDDDEPLVEYPTELVDDNKIRAARPRHRRRADRLPRRRAGRRRRRWRASWSSCSPPHADELGCRAELDGVEDLLADGTGAHRQLAIARAQRPRPARAGRGDRRDRPKP